LEFIFENEENKEMFLKALQGDTVLADYIKLMPVYLVKVRDLA